jgi:hypothetical protein
MRKVVIIRLRVYLLRDIWKIPLILEVDLVRETQKADPSPRRMFGVTIAKSKDIINPSVRS